jgi:flagellar basal-body rod modification protein FlgD
MASPLNSLLGSPSTSGTTSSSSPTANGSASSSAPSEEVFLQLLVSQLQNQDPLNPTDSTQFVSQLAQFSELEQVIAIRSDIETYMSESAQPSSTNPATPTGASTNLTNATDNSTTPANSADTLTTSNPMGTSTALIN